MLKLIVGTKGSGKTKTMIDMIDKAVKTTSGNIVVIEKCMKLTTIEVVVTVSANADDLPEDLKKFVI